MNGIIATLAFFSAAVHGYIFWLEAVAFDSATTRAAFRIRTPEQADAIRPWAYNQGFYNLFLAVAVLAGAVLLLAGATTVGVTKSALVQGLAPALTLLAIASTR